MKELEKKVAWVKTSLKGQHTCEIFLKQPNYGRSISPISGCIFLVSIYIINEYYSPINISHTRSLDSSDLTMARVGFSLFQL